MVLIVILLTLSYIFILYKAMQGTRGESGQMLLLLIAFTVSGAITVGFVLYRLDNQPIEDKYKLVPMPVYYKIKD